MKEKVYIIGGSGFIGKHLSVFLSITYDIVVFDKFIDEDYFSQYPQIQTQQLDVISNQIDASFDTPAFIVNLAATLVTADRNLSQIDQLMADNIKILQNLYTRFRKQSALKLLLQFGSIEEYGNGEIPFVEDQRELPNSSYALLKQATTNLAMVLYLNDNFPAMVVRPGNLFGKYQNEERFIAYIYKQLKQNKTLELTLCEQKRDFIFIDDFVQIVASILEKHSAFLGQIVNVSSGNSIRLKDIVEELKSLLSSTSMIEYGKIPYRENEVMDLNCNIEKLEKLMGKKMNISTLNRMRDFVNE